MEVSGRKDGDLSCSQLHGSDDAQLCCQPCKQDRSWVPAFGYCQNCAEHLCETCYKIHRKPAPCRDHILLDGTQMPQTQNSLCSATSTDLTETCQQHPGKLIEYFCKGHEVLGCSPCMTMKHRTCKIDYIPEVSSKYVTSVEYQNLLQSLETVQDNFKRLTEAAKENKSILLKDEKMVKADIERFRQEINAAFDKWEAEIYKEIEKHLSQENQKVDLAFIKSKHLEQRIEITINDFKALEQDGKVNTLYIRGKRNGESLKIYQSNVKCMQQEVHVKSAYFQPNLAIKNLLQIENKLGNILIHQRQYSRQQAEKMSGQTSTKQKPQPELKHPSFEDVSAKLAGQINVKTANDTTDCCITGIAVIDIDKLAVADTTNQSVKMIDVRQRTVISDLKLSSSPWDVMQLPEYQLAVSLPDEQLIQIVACADGLSKISQMKGSGACHGLAYIDGILVVTYGCTKEKVKVVSLNGTVLKTLYTSQPNYGFCFYTAIDRVNGNIYISDNSNSNVICLNKEGAVINKLIDESLMSKPCGLAVLEDGSVLVCNSKTCSINLISADFKNSRIILQEKDGINFPYSLALDMKEKKIYIGSGKRHNFVNVYSYK